MKRVLLERRERLRLLGDLRTAEDRRLAIHLTSELPISKLSILTGERRAFMRQVVDATGELNSIVSSATTSCRQAHQWSQSIESTLNHFTMPRYMATQWQDIVQPVEMGAFEDEATADAQAEPREATSASHHTAA